MPSRSKSSSSTKYTAKSFRSPFPSSVKQSTGVVARHKYDCHLASVITNSKSGPRYSTNTLQSIKHVMHQPGNRIMGSVSSNISDVKAVNKVVKAYHNDTRANLTPHQAAHIRSGANYIKQNADKLPTGFVNAHKQLYAKVYDSEGHKVVSMRGF